MLALYDKCCRSSVCWGEVGEQRLMSPELVQSTNEAIQKIRSRMHTTQSRQKSYADVRRKDLEFEVGDKVFLKVAPMRAYRLALPPSLSTVHDVFHVSMLRKYVPDPSHVVDYEPLEIDENLSYTEQPVEVLARETGSHLSFLEGNSGLTLKFTVPRQVNLEIVFLSSGGSVARGLDRGHNQVSGKGFPTTGPRIEAGNVVIHRGLHVNNVVACVPSGVRSCLRIDIDAHSVYCSYVNGLRCGLELYADGLYNLKCTLRLGASYGITGLIRASFGITRLICASFGITRLICASFGITRLIGVRVQQGADRREAGRMREGHMDAFGFLYASADVYC
ncbi:pol protein [Cucumis melo var. makuwa]|uniref:Pol protein n=1 Tax=Cucumis melo var. makuwa TaxID=1194695 RepID=A0A5A7U7V2_CUCMM|nr:pol protein [Cucumis melo var. makuwa]